MSEIRLCDTRGNRLYLTPDERRDFLVASRQQRRDVRTFCETLYYTGCRISEALEVTPKRVDLSAGQVIFRSLKKRRPDIYRTVPVPANYLDTLNAAHGIREAQRVKRRADKLLWSWTRQRGWQIVKAVMASAGITEGPHRTAKGLRHGFGVNAIANEIPLNMLKKWMGHADLATTAIYADAVGREEQDIAAKMWD